MPRRRRLSAAAPAPDRPRSAPGPAVSSSRQTLALSMCRSQPSNVHGRHGSGFCTIQTLPRFWMLPLACHGASRPPTGQGPQTRGSIGPNSATVGHPAAAARWRDRSIRPDVDPRPPQQRDGSRPCHRMDRGDAVPDVVEIAALGLVGPADRHDRQAALLEAGGERAPAFARPLLVAEHRRGMDHGVVVAGRNRFDRAGRRANQFRDARDAERIGKAEHLLDAMDVRHRRRAAMKQRALEHAAEPGTVRIGQADMACARRERRTSSGGRRSGSTPRGRIASTAARPARRFRPWSAAPAWR